MRVFDLGGADDGRSARLLIRSTPLPHASAIEPGSETIRKGSHVAAERLPMGVRRRIGSIKSDFVKTTRPCSRGSGKSGRLTFGRIAHEHDARGRMFPARPSAPPAVICRSMSFDDCDSSQHVSATSMIRTIPSRHPHSAEIASRVVPATSAKQSLLARGPRGHSAACSYPRWAGPRARSAAHATESFGGARCQAPIRASWLVDRF